MNDLGPLFRTSPQPQALRFAFEKSGLVLHNEPIPWNADAVIVEARLKLPGQSRASDFCLRLGDRNVPVENLSPCEDSDLWRLSFRFPPPASSTQAEIFLKHRSLGQLTLPVVSRQEFCKRLSFEMSTVAAKLGEPVVACEAFVGAQCQGLVVSAILSSPTSLAPLAELGLSVEARSQKTGAIHRAAVQLSSSQLAGKQALVSALLPKPRTTGAWSISWKLAERECASRRIRIISKPHFLRSLHLAESRFLVQDREGNLRSVAQLPPRKEIARAGPCFVLASRDKGVAGWCKLQVRALVPGAVQPPLLLEQDVLLTDGPFAFMPGTADVSDLDQIEGFELRCAGAVLGQLSLLPVPTGRFSAEGGFKPPPDFAWSGAAEEQLNQRLRKLMGG